MKPPTPPSPGDHEEGGWLDEAYLTKFADAAQQRGDYAIASLLSNVAVEAANERTARQRAERDVETFAKLARDAANNGLRLERRAAEALALAEGAVALADEWERAEAFHYGDKGGGDGRLTALRARLAALKGDG